MISTRIKQVISLCVLLTIGLYAGNTDAQTDEVRELVDRANALVAEGKTEQALDLYDQVIELKQIDQTAQYNKALMQYRAGDWENARQGFQEALKDPRPELRAKAHYNMGNSLYQGALQNLEQLGTQAQGGADGTSLNPEERRAVRQEAKAALVEAIQDYRQALRANRELKDARANIELASRLIKQLNEDQQEEDDQQDQQDQQEQQEQQEQDQNNEEDQQNQQQNENEDQQQDSQDQQDQNLDEQDQNKPQNQSGNQGQQGDQESENQPQENPQEQNQGADPQNNENEAENPENQQEEQQQNQESQQEQNPQRQEERKNPRDDRSNGGLRATSTMTELEAQRLLQEIRDRALKQRREELHRRAREHQGGDQNW